VAGYEQLQKDRRLQYRPRKTEIVARDPVESEAFPERRTRRDAGRSRLDPWLNQAVRSTLRPLRSFAKRLSADFDAVHAAVEPDWSNGPVEGHINRLKMLKRTMYGRAGLDLLGRRFLPAA
jgi:transposase